MRYLTPRQEALIQAIQDGATTLEAIGAYLGYVPHGATFQGLRDRGILHGGYCPTLDGVVQPFSVDLSRVPVRRVRQ